MWYLLLYHECDRATTPQPIERSLDIMRSIEDSWVIRGLANQVCKHCGSWSRFRRLLSGCNVPCKCGQCFESERVHPDTRLSTSTNSARQPIRRDGYSQAVIGRSITDWIKAIKTTLRRSAEHLCAHVEMRYHHLWWQLSHSYCFPILLEARPVTAIEAARFTFPILLTFLEPHMGQVNM